MERKRSFIDCVSIYLRIQGKHVKCEVHLGACLITTANPVVIYVVVFDYAMIENRRDLGYSVGACTDFARELHGVVRLGKRTLLGSVC